MWQWRRAADGSNNRGRLLCVDGGELRVLMVENCAGATCVDGGELCWCNVC